jgi:transglutaminase-like putative cysteine protease
MPRVRVVHTTEYRYRKPVRLTAHRLMLRPRDSHDLSLLDATLSLSPPSASTRWAHDVFGNSIAYIQFGDRQVELLRIISRLDLEHYPTAAEVPLDPAARVYPFNYAEIEVPDLAADLERLHPDPDGVVDQWAARFVSSDGTRTLDLLQAMTSAIKDEFRYEARDEEGTHAPLVTLATGAGACRDFALLMMEAARSLGMAARFISGYLYDGAMTAANAPVVGGGASHAWCAIYLPGAGWVEFDPTNGLIAGRNLIRVSVARTPAQAVPIGGGYLGEPEDFAGMRVDVSVLVGDAAQQAGG